jgi:hypothetical protein
VAQRSKGKDAVFVHVDRLGMEDFYVLPNKERPTEPFREKSKRISCSGHATSHALETSIPMIALEESFSFKSFLCASGKVNESARRHIVDEIKDPRIVILDPTS